MIRNTIAVALGLATLAAAHAAIEWVLSEPLAFAAAVLVAGSLFIVALPNLLHIPRRTDPLVRGPRSLHPARRERARGPGGRTHG